MCGRYSLTVDQEALSAALGVEGLLHPRPRYNIAPTQEIPIIVHGPVGRTSRWGLVPPWGDGLLINARSETAHRKPSFRSAFREGRCLIPADGFFEWEKQGVTKVPYWIHDSEPFTFAGLAERTVGEGGEVEDTHTILTTDADERLRPIHDRMPVILAPDERRRWLDPGTELEELREMLAGRRSDGLEIRRVSTRVNSAHNDDPACLEPESDDVQTDLF